MGHVMRDTSCKHTSLPKILTTRIRQRFIRASLELHWAHTAFSVLANAVEKIAFTLEQ